ncbi:PaaX family transcriptional regulator [Phytoactinopolyspora halotolerans]|uniref:PaaX family transcriptional regulator n=1 Tax=Phytoactinopolyspora halotolerans TaxID=1981512 RepID=A0A6L9SEP0_9ACTN|nr:PaaX family transcriptional regulator C-terminal domain-containing protein [Phytoactinopolyspora halotolerans]NEE02942.1 PaaX family transcriptional regulator [Phytoactinopolyspora halotolerans]
MPGDGSAPDVDADPRPPRPESLLLAFCGAHLLDHDRCVAVGSVIELLARLDVSEPATRAALNRMTKRGLFHSVRQGRHVYLRLTTQAETILRDGGVRLESETVRREWDGTWTLLAFSVPESRRAERHTLRTHLGWAGFGLLQNGLWISPSPLDISPTLAELGLLNYVKIFRVEATSTDPRSIAAEAWDLTSLADGYAAFLRRWTDGGPEHHDELCRQVLLETEWLLLIREDPRLPLELLPEGWPGVRSEEVFWSLRRQLDRPARRLADASLSWMPLEDRSRTATPR